MLIDPISLPARRVTVIAPHPDDESLGCGGLMSILGCAGRRVQTVFVTDGTASHPGSTAWPRPRLAAQRRAEAREALRLLGLDAHPREFLNLPDSGMPLAESVLGGMATRRLADLLKRFRPELVLMPWRRDPHRDHRDAWTLTTDALALADIAPPTLEYAIWLDEFGGAADQPTPDEAERVTFDISAAVGAKRAAIEAHLSQTTDLIDDDIGAFRLSPSTIARLLSPTEAYWRALT